MFYTCQKHEKITSNVNIFTLVHKTGAASKSDNPQTTIKDLRQFVIVQMDRDLIGNTITINLKKINAKKLCETKGNFLGIV